MDIFQDIQIDKTTQVCVKGAICFPEQIQKFGIYTTIQSAIIVKNTMENMRYMTIHGKINFEEAFSLNLSKHKKA